MHQTWFDEARIKRTVKREFVCSYLTPEEIGNLDKPLLFGDGLTNDTYWDWIETKARRLFLILLDLGVPDQIFGVIDDSWEDDDLPIPLDQVHRLALTEERDPRLEGKFYTQQFTYLLRTMQMGEHIDYDDQELVPLDVVEKRPAGSHHDIVEMPHCPGKTFSRRGVQLGLHMSREDFMCEISLIRDLQNGHIESYYASYTHHGHAYVLFTPVSEYKLSSYLTNTPTVLKNVDKLAKRRMVLDWIHCLVDTLSLIHSNGEALGNIKPSTVSFTHDHHVLLPDSTCFNPDTLLNRASSGGSSSNSNAKSFSKEGYDYAAPEQCSRPSTSPPSARARTWTIPAAPDAKSRSSNFTIVRGAPPLPPHIEPSRQHLILNHYHHHHHQQPLPLPPPLPLAPPPPTQRLNTTISDAQAADIFSLGCTILDLLSHGLLKRSSSAFAAVRSAKHKNAGRGGAVLDSSFHKNLGQVELWMDGLSKDADKKSKKVHHHYNHHDDHDHDHDHDGGGGGGGGGGSSSDKKGTGVFRAVTPILHIVERMLAVQPSDRPSATQVQGWVYQIITEVAGIHEPHCLPRPYGHNHSEARAGGAGGGIGTGIGTGMAATSIHSPTTFLEPPSPSFDNTSSSSTTNTNTTTHHHYQASSAPTTLSSKRSSIFSIRTLSHRRAGSDESSSVGKAAMYTSAAPGEDRWGLGGGGGGGGGGWVPSMQNLRMGLSKTKLWQTPSLPESTIVSSAGP